MLVILMVAGLIAKGHYLSTSAVLRHEGLVLLVVYALILVANGVVQG